MNRKNNRLIFFALAAMLVATIACRGGSSTAPTSVPQPTQEVRQMPTEETVQQNSGALEIKSSSSYTDSFNDYNVVGELVNNTNETLENITLSLSITDASGASLLKDSEDNPVDTLEFQPYLSVLVPGGSTPFNYYISADEVTPAKYDVSIKDYDESSAPDLAEISLENVQSTDTEDGDILITGELINLSSQQVDVETLAGAVLDDENRVIAANSTLTYSRYLYPAGDAAGRDRGPFIVRLFGPIENATQWKVYARAIQNTYTQTTDVQIQLGGSYVDVYGSYHLLGTIKNNASSQISPAIIGGLYNADKAVFDAAALNIPLYLNAGESAPFDLNSFQVIGSLPADQATPADQTVKPDLYWTFSTDYEVVSLEAQNVSVKPDGSNWIVDGTVVNNSGKKLSSISAVVMFLDENQNVMATNTTSVYPAEDAEAINPGDSSPFSIWIYSAEAWDLTTRNYQIILQGVVTE